MFSYTGMRIVHEQMVQEAMERSSVRARRSREKAERRSEQASTRQALRDHQDCCTESCSSSPAVQEALPCYAR